MGEVSFAMGLLMKAFNAHAARQGNKDTLTRAEAKALLKEQFGQEGKCEKELEKMFEDLDSNNDDVVDFTEYMGMVTRATCGIHGMFRKCTKGPHPGMGDNQ